MIVLQLLTYSSGINFWIISPKKTHTFIIISENNSKPKIIEQMYLPVFHLSHFTTGSWYSAEIECYSIYVLDLSLLLAVCVFVTSRRVLADDKSHTSKKTSSIFIILMEMEWQSILFGMHIVNDGLTTQIIP